MPDETIVFGPRVQSGNSLERPKPKTTTDVVRTMEGRQYVASAVNTMMLGVQKDIHMRMADQRRRNVENFGPIHMEAQTLLEGIGMLGDASDLIKKVEKLLIGLTMPIGKGNPFVGANRRVLGMFISNEASKLDALLGTLDPVQRGYIRSVVGLLLTVRDYQVKVDDSGLMGEPINKPSIDGQIARGALIASQSPHAQFFRHFGKIGGLALGASLMTLGVGISTIDFIQGKGLDWNWAQVLGGGIGFALAGGFNLPGIQEAKKIAEQDVKLILANNGISGDKGGEVFDLLTTSSYQNKIRAYLGSTEGDAAARATFLEAMGNNPILAKLSDQQLRRLVDTCSSISNPAAKELARGYVVGGIFNT